MSPEHRPNLTPSIWLEVHLWCPIGMEGDPSEAPCWPVRVACKTCVAAVLAKIAPPAAHKAPALPTSLDSLP